MKKCESCGVLVEDDLDRCPLCRVKIDDGNTENEVPEPTAERRATVAGAKLWLWHVVSLLAFISSMIVVAADFAAGFNLSWSRYPVSAIVYVWAAVSAAIFLYRRPFVVLIAEAAAVIAFLFAISRMTPSTAWFSSLALPIAVIVFFVIGTVVTVCKRLALSAVPSIAVVLLGIGVKLVALEVTIGYFVDGAFGLSWSLVTFACAVSLFVTLLFVNARLGGRRREFKRIFHV
ncbi:MAG: hypothetical protein EA426_14415 [Spirochaetaceae bacterium]|nr:MAG: hypothetical protein EA426_14415 [Spirochaetaceae bacterium]